ncbi:carboxypeptidase N subunit 2 [Anguilla anguilla]|uniref:carboxypeptidase N subunit 2 n=1 Tax=Anguilla anguilla TaxID=7936 RepID=UPI0015A8313F|nr:carboxypeptidase N subunit 2 [Anguilla anguilla]
MMTKAFCVTLFILLQLSYHGYSCPIKCQCFTPTRAICSDEGSTDMPQNISSDVKELVIMTTGIMYLRPKAFPDGSKLSKLVFLNNLLQGVSRMAFNNLLGLEELEISGNHRLEELYLGTLSELQNLTTLVLNFNRFRVLREGLLHPLQKLETLQLKGNVIYQLTDDLFQQLGRLRLLDLSLNTISTVNKEIFRNLGQLRTLRLGYNLIEALPPDTFDGVPRLRELSLQGNKIVRFPQALFSRLAQLDKLNLRGNQIKELTADAFPPGLSELNLADNKLTVLSPEMFQGLPRLTCLLLSKNQLSVIPEDLFQNLTALEHVDLSHNLIGGLPEVMFRGLSELAVVHLENNNISSLPSGLFEDQDYLEQLYLSDNALQNIPVEFMDAFLAHNMIRLHGNPWTCDCHLLYLYDWLMYSTGLNQDTSNMYCRAPSFLSGRGLMSLKREQLVCAANTSTPLQSTHEAVTRPEETPPTTGCVVQETNSTISVKCTNEKCPQIKLRTWYRKEGYTEDTFTEHILLQGTQCLNSTITITF